MSQQQEDPTRGDRGLLAEMPTVPVAGRTITMRRLRYRDLARLSRIIVAGRKAAGVEIAPLIEANAIVQGEAFVVLVMAGFGHAEADAMAFLARLLGVKPEDLDDPDLFPPASLLDVVMALAQHPDLVAFFARRRTGKPETDTATVESSTEPSSALSTD